MSNLNLKSCNILFADNMAKRSVDFQPPRTPTRSHKEEGSPLSPSKITDTDQHATVSGLLASISPTRPTSRYFDGDLTDGESVIRLVGFDKHKQQQLQSFCDFKMPVTLRDCLIQCNKFKNNLEVVLKSNTRIESSTQQFNVPDLKTVGSSIINLSQLNNLHEHEGVTIRVTVLKVNKAETVSGGKIKQEILVADSTGKATLTLWESNIDSLKLHKLYQLNRLQIR